MAELERTAGEIYAENVFPINIETMIERKEGEVFQILKMEEVYTNDY